ncbi:hypothetical protein TNCV_1180821, partial [Trichonephila clavipes]
MWERSGRELEKGNFADNRYKNHQVGLMSR